MTCAGVCVCMATRKGVFIISVVNSGVVFSGHGMSLVPPPPSTRFFFVFFFGSCGPVALLI